MEPDVIKKANQFVSFKFGEILDILNFLGGATNLNSFLKVDKTSETKGFIPYEKLNHPDKLNNKELPPNEAFHNKLWNGNPLEKEYLDYEKLNCSCDDRVSPGQNEIL